MQWRYVASHNLNMAVHIKQHFKRVISWEEHLPCVGVTAGFSPIGYLVLEPWPSVLDPTHWNEQTPAVIPIIHELASRREWSNGPCMQG